MLNMKIYLQELRRTTRLCGLYYWGSIIGSGWDFSLRHCFHTGSGAHPSYQMGYRG